MQIAHNVTSNAPVLHRHDLGVNSVPISNKIASEVGRQKLARFLHMFGVGVPTCTASASASAPARTRARPRPRARPPACSRFEQGRLGGVRDSNRGWGGVRDSNRGVRDSNTAGGCSRFEQVCAIRTGVFAIRTGVRDSNTAGWGWGICPITNFGVRISNFESDSWGICPTVPVCALWPIATVGT